MVTNFSQIVFDGANHTYTLNGQKLTGATKILYALKPPFEAEKWATKKALERGLSKDVILAEWEANRKASTERGTKVHKYIEDCLKGTSTHDADPLLALNGKLPEMAAFDSFWSSSQGFLVPIQIEWVIGDGELGIAGTADTLFINQKTGGYVLFDWKTGSKFNTSNRFQRLLPPFYDCDDCELNNYSLQSSLYRLIIERNTDFILDDGYIVHLNSLGTFEIHKALDFRGRLLEWLKK